MPTRPSLLAYLLPFLQMPVMLELTGASPTSSQQIMFIHVSLDLILYYRLYHLTRNGSRPHRFRIPQTLLKQFLYIQAASNDTSNNAQTPDPVLWFLIEFLRNTLIRVICSWPLISIYFNYLFLILLYQIK